MTPPPACFAPVPQWKRTRLLSELTRVRAALGAFPGALGMTWWWPHPFKTAAAGSIPAISTGSKPCVVMFASI